MATRYPSPLFSLQVAIFIVYIPIIEDQSFLARRLLALLSLTAMAEDIALKNNLGNESPLYE